MRFGSSVGYDRYPAELPKIREKKGGNNGGRRAAERPLAARENTKSSLRMKLTQLVTETDMY